MAASKKTGGEPAPSNTLTLPGAAKGELKDLGGSISDDWNLVLINQAIASLWTANSDDETRQQQRLATGMALGGIKPRDEIEGMLAAQMVGVHNASMECLRRAMHREQTFEARKENLNQANKLSRTYAALVEALNRHRGKGQQKVTVEHVHVHVGGQAVGGNVEAGGGATAKIEEQSHAQIAQAHEPSLWSQDESRNALPVARDEERSMQDARRD